MAQRLEAQGSNNGFGKWDHGSDQDEVAKIRVRCGSEGIELIRFDYTKSGQPKTALYYDIHPPNFTHKYELNHRKGEQLESVEGYYEAKSKVIYGLRFKTNLRISKLIGYERGTKFSLAVEGKKIIGFHGSYNSKLKSLGAYFTWITPTRMEAKGVRGGKVWNDGSDHEGITKIYVRGNSDGIQFIQFDYVKDGQQIYGLPHGVSGKGFTETFEINHLEKEYLVSVDGYYNNEKSEMIQGIRFQTNIKTSGLMGDDKGRKFSLGINGKKIIGFHGYAGRNLNSLGAYFISSSFTRLESRGDTTIGDIWNDGVFEGVRNMRVYYDDECVRGLEIDYENGGKMEVIKHGLTSGNAGKFSVDYPNELITSVEGTLKTSGNTWVKSLVFKTSKGRTSRTFGSSVGSKFVLESKGCALVGFHGRSGESILSSIGAYFRPLPPSIEATKQERKVGSSKY